MSLPISARLLAAAKFVRQGAYFADIGTDHAYLPLFLLKSGIIAHAVCADINEGPLATARKNAAEAGLLSMIDFYLTDGVAELSHLPITDYAICGMGGELISGIISRAPHLKQRGIRLVLQPMTRVEELRTYLAASGFSVVCEDYVTDTHRSYVILVAEYTGECRELDLASAYLGESVPRVVLNEPHREYLIAKRRSLSKSLEGKMKGGEDFSTEKEIVSQIDKILNE